MVDKVRKHFVRIVTDDEIRQMILWISFDVVQSSTNESVFTFDGNGNKAKQK